jgi:hypothetical protein
MTGMCGKLESCREVESKTRSNVLFDRCFPISSNKKSLRTEASFRHCPTQAMQSGGCARAFFTSADQLDFLVEGFGMEIG